MKPAVVVDASALSEAIVDGGERGQAIEGMLSDFGTWIAPHHVDLECTSSWLRMVRRGGLAPEDMTTAMADLAVLPIERRATHWFAERIGELIANLTPYDAAYVVLAETYHLPLLTADARLARAPVPQCEFIVC